MRSKTTLPITAARKKIFAIADDVERSDAAYTLTDRGYPKAVIISASRFEKMSKEKTNVLRLADGPSGLHAGRTQFFAKVLVVRDASKIVYLDGNGQEDRYREEGLIKSQLFIKLIEEYKYPLLLVEIGRYVKVGGLESKRYIEADIIINDRKGNAEIIFEVSSFDSYEDNLDKIVSDLFDVAYASTWVKKPRYLVYYSRASQNGKEVEKIGRIDYLKFNTFSSWKKAGRPMEHTFPSYSELSTGTV